MFDLTGKRALVCGSTQGIGRACADVLARNGAALTLIARNEASLKKAAAAIAEETGRTVDTVCADFREPDALRDKVSEYVKRTGAIHILVNNTGGPPHGAIADATAEQFLQGFKMHIVCNQLLVQTLAPGMKQAGYGRIINIISTSVREPIMGLGVSNTIRGAVASWAKTHSKELAPLGITVNNVLPGYTNTDRLRDLIAARAEAQSITTEQVEQRMKAVTPMGRFAGPEEIAAGVAFLASPAASYITGVSLPVDGGRIASI